MIVFVDQPQVEIFQAGYLAGGGVSDLGAHLDKILSGHRALEVAEAVVLDDAHSGSQQVIREYGRALKSPIAFIVRDQILVPASDLPYKKSAIKAALIDGLNFGTIAPSDVQSLGDLFVYLAYFVDDFEAKDNAGVDLWALHHAEKAALIAEWRKLAAQRKPFLSRRSKPNA